MKKYIISILLLSVSLSVFAQQHKAYETLTEEDRENEEWENKVSETEDVTDFTFKLVTTKEKEYYPHFSAIQIFDRESGRFVQEIDLLPYDYTQWLGPGNIGGGDFNFDGHTDFSLFACHAAGANTVSLYFLYDPAAGTFFESGFDGTNLEFYPSDSTIVSTNQGMGGSYYIVEKYTVENNAMVFLERHDFIVHADNGEFIEMEMSAEWEPLYEEKGTGRPLLYCHLRPGELVTTDYVYTDTVRYVSSESFLGKRYGFSRSTVMYDKYDSEVFMYGQLHDLPEGTRIVVRWTMEEQPLEYDPDDPDAAETDWAETIVEEIFLPEYIYSSLRPYEDLIPYTPYRDTVVFADYDNYWGAEEHSKVVVRRSEDGRCTSLYEPGNFPYDLNFGDIVELEWIMEYGEDISEYGEDRSKCWDEYIIGATLLKPGRISVFKNTNRKEINYIHTDSSGWLDHITRTRAARQLDRFFACTLNKRILRHLAAEERELNVLLSVAEEKKKNTVYADLSEVRRKKKRDKTVHICRIEVELTYGDCDGADFYISGKKQELTDPKCSEF